MDSTLFMGLFVGAVLALLAGFGIIAAHIVRPVINLNKSITKLQDSVDALQKNDEDIETSIKEQHVKLENHESRILKLEVRRRQ